MKKELQKARIRQPLAQSYFAFPPTGFIFLRRSLLPSETRGRTLSTHSRRKETRRRNLLLLLEKEHLTPPVSREESIAFSFLLLPLSPSLVVVPIVQVQLYKLVVPAAAKTPEKMMLSCCCPPFPLSLSPIAHMSRSTAETI